MGQSCEIMISSYYTTYKTRIFRYIPLCFILCLFFAISCKKETQSTPSVQEFDELKKRISRRAFPTDSLQLLLSQSKKKNDYQTLAAVYKIMGQRMRDSSKFSQAIIYHQNGLNAALKLKDTLDIVQLFNQLGTDFRRIGAYPEASDYHFRALSLIETYSDKDSYAGKKNKVRALNGIGNIYLSLKNPAESEKYFREALFYEKELGSALGQAINYANIGTMYRMTEQYDSAFLYYNRSMEQNIIARSNMGIGLCYIYFGNIYEQKKEYDNAEIEYRKTYNIMEDISDDWHWLGACLSLGRIHLLKNNDQKAYEYILKAKAKAEKINTPDYLSEAYELMHQFHERRGDYRNALKTYKLSQAWQDSVRNISKINQALDMRLNYERKKNALHIKQLNIQYENQKNEKNIITTAAVIIIIFMILFLATLFYAYLHRVKSNRMLKEVNKMRSNFFTNITHELRTPLTIILGLVAHIKKQEKTMTAEVVSYLDNIEKQGDNLLQLVNRMLNMAKMEAGVEKPEWRTGNIIAYLEMLVESYRLYACKKMLDLNFYAEESALEMDFVPHYINEIVCNLLSNAIKFTPSGGKITLHASRRKSNLLSIKVTDNGMGISREDLKRIFEPFFCSSDADKNTGSGIGLHYTRQLTKAMHGNISAQSKTGEGAIFIVELPIKQKGKTAFPAPETNEVHKTLPFYEKEEETETAQENVEIDAYNEVITLLVVEDNKDIMLYIRALLPKEYRVIHAEDGQKGMEKANELVPDLIISDVMMPHKDGFELCSEVKSSELLNHIPVILLTAKNDKQDLLTGLKCGADAYIGKPFHPDELLIRIDKLLENRRVLKEKYRRFLLKEDNQGEKQTEKDVNIDFLQHVTDIIYSEMDNPDFTTSILADKLCMSASQLSRKMMVISGYNLSSYILNMRMNKAKKLLADEKIPITEIAYNCGFYDPAYFSRTFKKQTGFTPSQYRRNQFPP